MKDWPPDTGRSPTTATGPQMTLIASRATHSDQHKKKTAVGGQQFPEQMVKSTGIRTDVSGCPKARLNGF
jgi:hypothetical protein